MSTDKKLPKLGINKLSKYQYSLLADQNMLKDDELYITPEEGVSKDDLKNIAFTGNYDDLINKPQFTNTRVIFRDWSNVEANYTPPSVPVTQSAYLPGMYETFCFNSGATTDDGEPDLIKVEEINNRTIITLKAPCVYTDGNSKTTKILEDKQLDATDFTANIKYSLRVENVDGVINFFAVPNANVYRQKALPQNPQVNDLWQNLAVQPSLAYIYNGETWVVTNQVEVGEYTKDV